MPEMEDFERWWSVAASWVDLNVRALWSISPELLLALGAACALVILFFCAWVYTIRRNKALKRRLRSLAGEFAVVKQKYESEVAWRMAADKVFGKQSGPPVPSGDRVN